MPSITRHASVQLLGNALLLAKLSRMRCLSRRTFLCQVSMAIVNFVMSHLSLTFCSLVVENVASKFSPPTGFLNTYQSPKKGTPRGPVILPNHIAPLDFNTRGMSLSVLFSTTYKFDIVVSTRL